MFKRRNRFLDVNLRPTNKQLETDLQIKLTDAHQFLHTTSRYPHHCKKRIPYSQVLRYNQICSDNEKFDQCCHDLEKWLMERGYNEGMVYSKKDVNLGIAFLNEGIAELLRVNLLLTSVTIQRFRMSEAYCRNLKPWGLPSESSFFPFLTQKKENRMHRRSIFHSRYVQGCHKVFMIGK